MVYFLELFSVLEQDKGLWRNVYTCISRLHKYYYPRTTFSFLMMTANFLTSYSLQNKLKADRKTSKDLPSIYPSSHSDHSLWNWKHMWRLNTIDPLWPCASNTGVKSSEVTASRKLQCCFYGNWLGVFQKGSTSVVWQPPFKNTEVEYGACTSLDPNQKNLRSQLPAEPEDILRHMISKGSIYLEAARIKHHGPSPFSFNL